MISQFVVLNEGPGKHDSPVVITTTSFALHSCAPLWVSPHLRGVLKKTTCVRSVSSMPIVPIIIHPTKFVNPSYSNGRINFRLFILAKECRLGSLRQMRFPIPQNILQLTVAGTPHYAALLRNFASSFWALLVCTSSNVAVLTTPDTSGLRNLTNNLQLYFGFSHLHSLSCSQVPGRCRCHVQNPRARHHSRGPVKAPVYSRLRPPCSVRFR
jgi:hypothetical protein